MPLESTGAPGEQYIRRVRIHVDPDERDRTRSKSQFSFLYPLNNLYEKVIGIELVDYNVRSGIQRTFVEREGQIPGNNKVDIHMEDVATGLQVLDFTLTIPSETLSDPLNNLSGYLNDQMDAQGHAFHNTGAGVLWTVTTETDPNPLGQDSTLQFQVEAGAVANTIEANFLFGTGANVGDSAAEVLGFPAGVDTAVFVDATGTIQYYPIPTHQPTAYPFRYLTVNVREFPELKPLATIFLTDNTSYSLSREGMHRTRLLHDPVKRMEEMRIDLTLADGRSPVTEFCSGVDLVFELLLVAPETTVPGWVEQQFRY